MIYTEARVGSSRNGFPRDAIAYYTFPNDASRKFVIPYRGESDFAAVRRVAAELGIPPREMVIIRNLK